MATEVLRQTSCHNTPFKIREMEIAGCVEHPAALLSDRSSYRACTLPEECTQRGNLRQCAPFGLTGSLRIELNCEQSHSREVKTIEGDKQQVRLLKTRIMLVRGVPDERGTPEHLSGHEVSNMSKNNEQNLNDQELPPLPQRVITGVPDSWVPVDGKLFHTVRIWEFTILYALLEYNLWKTISDFLKKHSNLTALGRQLKISRKILHHIKVNPKRSIRIPNLLKLCRIVGLNLDVVEKSIQSVRFNHSGYIEHLSFPFNIDIYAWRAICHIAGDGCIGLGRGNSYPYLTWSQKQCNQQ